MSGLRAARRARMKARADRWAGEWPIDPAKSAKLADAEVAADRPEPAKLADADILPSTVLAGGVALWALCATQWNPETLGCAGCDANLRELARQARESGLRGELLDAVEALPVRPEGVSGEAERRWADSARGASIRLAIAEDAVVQAVGGQAVRKASELLLDNGRGEGAKEGPAK